MRGGSLRQESFDLAGLGIVPAEPAALRGADAPHNAAVTRAVLAGTSGPVRDAVLLKAAAAIVAYDAEDDPLVPRLQAGWLRGAEALDSGAAADLLDRWISVSGTLR